MKENDKIDAVIIKKPSITKNQSLGILKKIEEDKREVTWEFVKEFVTKEILVFGEAFSINDNMKNKRQNENILKGLQYIYDNFNSLNNNSNEKLDKKFANKDNPEFVLLIKRVLENIKKQDKDENIKYLANFIVNVVKKENSNNPNKEDILNKILNLNVEHVLVLKYFYDTSCKDDDIDQESRCKTKNSEINININTLTINRIGNTMLNKCFKDLESDGFICEITESYIDYMGGNYYMTDYGKKCVELLKNF